MNNSMQCIISIVERGKSEHLIHTFKDNNCYPYLQFRAHGTASSEVLDILGFDGPKRDVIISLASTIDAYQLMNELKSREKIKLHTKGIIFTIPINALSALLAKATVTPSEEYIGENIMTTNKESLILVSINQGYSDEVMTTAKHHGAKGGTVIRANFSDAQFLEEKYNISIHKEKEILAIVANNDIKKDIMDNIHNQHGLNTKAQAIIISVPVTSKIIL